MKQSRAILKFFFRYSLYPLTNLSIAFSGIILLFFIIMGSLKESHVLLYIFLIPILHIFLANPISRRMGTSWTHNLPVSKTSMLCGFSTAFILPMVILILFGYYMVALYQQTGIPPEAKPIYHDVITPSGDTLKVVKAQFKVYGEYKTMTIIAPTSIMKDGFLKVHQFFRYVIPYHFTMILFVLFLVFDKNIRRGSKPLISPVLKYLPLVIYSIFGILILTDPLLTQHMASIVIAETFKNSERIKGFIALMSAANLLIIGFMVSKYYSSNAQ